MITEERLAEFRDGKMDYNLPAWHELLQLVEVYEAARTYVANCSMVIERGYTEGRMEDEERAHDALLAHFPEAPHG